MTDVLILGGGYAGMAATLWLGQQKVESTLVEAMPELGGIARCVRVAGELLERCYHHAKPDDQHFIELTEKLGMAQAFRWQLTRMAFYSQGRLHPFSSSMDLLRYPYFSIWDKLCFARGMLKMQRTNSETLKGSSARDWIVRQWSKNIYEQMMGPLLWNKFGISPERVCAGFLHGRMKGLSSSKSKVRGGDRLGYLLGSAQILTDCIAAKLNETSRVHTDFPVQRLERIENGFRVWSKGQNLEARYIINTLPLDIFAAMPKNFAFDNHVKYQAAVCGIFAIEDNVDLPYWTNVIDSNATCKILVNQSVLSNYPYTMLYLGNYLNQDHPLLKAETTQIEELYCRDLKTFLGSVKIVDCKISRFRHATPVFDIDFAKETADLQTRVPRMLFAGAIDIYPHTRTLSSVIASGYRAAQRIHDQLNGREAEQG